MNASYQEFKKTVGKHWFLYLVGSIGLIIINFCDAIAPKVIQWLIDLLVTKDTTQIPAFFRTEAVSESVGFLSLALLLNFILAFIGGGIWRQGLMRMMYATNKDLRLELWRRLKEYGTNMSLKDKIKHIVQEEDISYSSDLSGIVYLFFLSRSNLYKLCLATLILVASVGCIMFSARLLGELFQLLAHDKSSSQLYHYAFAFLLLEILAATLRYLGSIFMAYTTTRVVLEIRKKLFTKLTRLPITYYDNQPLGRVISRVTTDVEGVENFFIQVLASSLSAFIEVFLVLVAMLITDFEFGILIVASSFPVIIFTLIAKVKLKFWFRIKKKLDAVVIARFAEFANGFEVIKSFNLKTWTYDKFKEINLLNYAVQSAILGWESLSRPMIIFLCSLPLFFIFYFGGEMVIAQTLSIAVFVSFVRLSEKFITPMRLLAHNAQIIQEALASAERVRHTLQEKEEKNPENAIEKEVWGDITFADVQMDYKRDKSALQQISFEIKKGMKTGLVGETGAGKTSTVNLIPALYNYSAGEIRIDGISLRKWAKPSLRRHIGYISQDVGIFRGTLRENIVCGQKQVADHSIYCLAEQLGFNLGVFSSGLNTMIFEHGKNLSAGESQVIAFMRMMIKEPSILILDEATANVDSTYEKMLHNALFEVMADKTCFIIAHRLSTIKKCDLILVFKNGHIIERGTHTDLITREQGYYRRLHTALM